MHQHLLKHQKVWPAYSEGQYSPADVQICGTDLPLMQWRKENHTNPSQTQRAFIGMTD